MNIAKFIVFKLITGIPLILGVTFLSFLLMVYFGPDLTYELLGKNPTEQDISAMRQYLGYDQPFIVRYLNYLKELLTFDFGLSMTKDKPVIDIIKQSLPVSLLLMTPGFILGNVLALMLALGACQYRGQWQDKTIMTLAVLGMSISFLVVIISFQIFFSSSYGLNWFPVRGWQTTSPDGSFSWLNYLSFVSVPTLATMFVALGYNTRFYRAVLVDELKKDYVTTAKAYGHHPKKILYFHLLKNAMIPIITRIIFTIPLVVISGSLLIESYFGIPGIGLVTYDAIVAGDQPILKSVIGLTSVLFVLALIAAELLYQLFDPRIKQVNP